MVFSKSPIASRRSIVRFACYWVTFFLLATVHWLEDNFGPTTLPQLLYYAHFSNGLISQTDIAFLVTFCLECLLAPTLVATLLIAIERFVDAPKITRAIIPLRFAAESTVGRFIAALKRAFPFYTLAISLWFFLWALSAFAYMRSMFAVDPLASIYVAPATVEVQAKALKNLVLIYVESLETSYSNKEFFGEDLLTDLNALPGSSFESYLPAPGTGWTTAAIVATQCGIPLQFVMSTPLTAHLPDTSSFLPHATCLGDILKKIGYHNVFLGGANLNFAAKGKFLRRHGYQDIYGAFEWQKEIDGIAQRFNEWGLYDDDLLLMAKVKLLELKEADKRFNLTILTLDTHQPKGYYSKLCIERGAVKFEDIIKCTSSQVADFINFAIEHDLLKNTNFIVIGDHLANSNPVYGKLKLISQRRIFNKFIAENLPIKNREVVVPFDFLPTMLEFLGIEVSGNRLALGCSAFFEASPPCSQSALDDSLGELSFSGIYRKLWVD